MTETVLLDIAGNIATITLNRPEVHNAFDEHVILRLGDLLEELAERKDLYAVVLCGAGKSFSAGADLGWMKRAADFTEEQNKADALALAHMLRKLDTLPQVTIACVQGAAMGGGLGLAACCDIVIAEENAKFALSEVKLGLIPATIGPYVIKAIGARQARRYFQTGERFSAARAYEIGLVHMLTKNDQGVDEILQTLFEELAKNGALAMRESKKLCMDLAGSIVSDEMIEDTACRIAKIRTGKEAQQRLKEFLDK